MAFHSMPRATQQRVGRTRRNQKLRIAAGRCGEAFVRKTLRLFQIWQSDVGQFPINGGVRLGKSSINLGIFSIATFDYQRVAVEDLVVAGSEVLEIKG